VLSIVIVELRVKSTVCAHSHSKNDLLGMRTRRCQVAGDTEVQDKEEAMMTRGVKQREIQRVRRRRKRMEQEWVCNGEREVGIGSGDWLSLVVGCACM